MKWKKEFDQVLPLLGHRNWILVVDKAYPSQSAPGITTIDTQAPLPAVLEKVVAAIKASSHVKPIFYTDKELGFITESMAPGVAALRKELARVLAGAQTQTLLHDSVFAKLAEASKLFNVVILKTESVVAYSSVFIELDCAYWSAEKEQALRKKMK
jgi:Ni/Fe-hydrogenase subunit HybB-like protein